MAEYKEIHGTKIRNYTTNPDNPLTGEGWYNDTDKVLKFSYPNVTTAGSWRTANSLGTARSYASGGGIYTAGIVFGGNLPPAGGNTETFNGTNWTEVNDLTTARYYGAGAGTSTAAIMIGGTPAAKDNTELWNGTNWTEVNNLNEGRQGNAAAGQGTTTASLTMGGEAPGNTANTESWNGTN